MNAREIVHEELHTVRKFAASTKVTEVIGPVVKAKLIAAAVGDLLEIQARPPQTAVLGQVIGFTTESLILGVFGSASAILPGARATLVGQSSELKIRPCFLGAVVDALGNILEPGATPLDRSAKEGKFETLTLEAAAPPPLERLPIDKPFVTGIRAIDGFLTIGCGQRLCILAEPGVGKSMLLSSIARTSAADVNVIGLIGERGREIKELLNETLPPEVRSKTVVVVSTSDQAPLLRVAAASTATRVAEYFRAQGKSVLLQIDSLTRYLRALREIGLAAGEMPVRRGYPPSVFTKLPQLIERAGTDSKGSITALYTVLLSSDLDEDPMVDELKGLTDGHLTLSKRLADSSHFPAIDITASLSRLSGKLLDRETYLAAGSLRKAIAKLDADEELMRFGAVADGELSRALKVRDPLGAFLRQSEGDASDFQSSLQAVRDIAALMD